MLDYQHSEDVPGMLVICGTINLKIFCFIKATSALNSTSRLVQRARRLYFAAEEHCQVESKVQEHLGRRQTELENCRSLCFARLSTSKPLPTCEALHNTQTNCGWPRFNASHYTYLKNPGSFSHRCLSRGMHYYIRLFS